MNEQVLSDLYDGGGVTTSAASGFAESTLTVRRDRMSAAFPGDLTSDGSQIVPPPIRVPRAQASPQSLASLSEQLVQNLALFPKTGDIIVNEHGLYVPGVLLGKNPEINHEVHRSPSGTIRVTITAHPRSLENLRRADKNDFSRELRWLNQHRDEYAGKWVALAGDRLIAAGTNALEVYESARESGVDLPLVTQIEPADELPFGGW